MINRVLNKVKEHWKFKKEAHLKPEEMAIIRGIKAKNLTYLSNGKLATIVNAINSANELNTKGLFVEAGCALGGSSILISKLKYKQASLLVFDVFGMIPEPTKEDTDDVHERYQTIAEGKSTGLGGDLYYGYEDNLYDKVLNNFKSFDVYPEKENVQLIKGLVQETMNISEPVVFAHIDVDWYEPVMTCLEQIWPNLVVGGNLILDDYHDWGGCRKATDEFFKNLDGQYAMDDNFGSMCVTRIR